MDKISIQLDDLLDAVRQSEASSQDIVNQLAAIGRNLIPKHGLCIDKNCAMCRVHEEAIKEHVLVYVDWRVPGTVQKFNRHAIEINAPLHCKSNYAIHMLVNFETAY
ncbi:MAG: hypothetical protein CM1200mP15_12070 [Dehalococcoidia bacterium]|nr:MAG: hypothetical protein CM1200mP15_12070 [Dehalococcoidia bacterium]